MIHMIHLTVGSVNCTCNPGIAAGPTRIVFKNRTRVIFITLQAIIKASVRFVEWLVFHPGFHACPETFRSCVFDVILPYINTR